MPLQLLSVTSEVYPLIKTGGLADVAGALPAALARQDIAVTTLMPGYPAVMQAIGEGEPVRRYENLMGGPGTLRRGRAADLDLLVLDAPYLFARDGNPYLGPDGRDWPDNPLRFAALSRVAADIAEGALGSYAPDVVQAHDWQAGLTPAYLHYNRPARRPPVVTTIHNLAFQGVFPAYLLGTLGLPAEAFSLDGLEYFGAISFLKGGILFADHVTTVSPSYAREITTAEGGMGLEGLLGGRTRYLSGILNGIDTRIWDPAHDPLIPAPFSADDLAGRAGDKAALQREFGLAASPDAFLIASVGRLTEQKGLDLLLGALPALLAEGAQFAILGSGDRALEAAFTAAAASHPGQIGCRIGYDEGLAHLLQAGADALVVPSRFEPCGLTQLCALRYGAVPIVSHVGGLADTVIDASPVALRQRVATGFQFTPSSEPMLIDALRRAAALFREDRAAWKQLQQNGLATDVSWDSAAQEYAALFRKLLTPSA
ncbi:glycogen synthase GlgA [Sphingomonas xinjiangensis]|uniref:Glycogen synthase n=1 Tax=Sphingomonas xinjiangensis TaxID=643568 RepID=A0A840YQH3_9SPHN|nr:glycogen synthase GlgA [Sphingomonas xinjiangensis]MBB5710922.1 starch synthase [Sphingomonas xinjiangensis]